MNLQLGKIDEVIETLEPVADPTRLSSNNDSLLIQAYQMAGKTERAKSYTQITMYLQIIKLIGNSIGELTLYSDQYERCQETMLRTMGMIEIFHIEKLHPNLAAQFYYQMAAVCVTNEKNDEAMMRCLYRQLWQYLYFLWHCLDYL